jgi:hypothetical protein
MLGQTGFEVKVNIALRGFVVIAHMAMLYMFFSQPMFYLPVQWTSPLNRLLSFPSAPTGQFLYTMTQNPSDPSRHVLDPSMLFLNAPMCGYH